MSVEKRRLEGERWLLQAEDDLEAARVLLEAGKYAQSAFMAQQAGEKAVKGLWFALGLDPWGNSLTRLVRELPEEWGRSLEGLLPSALALDKLYV
ncbi:MAG: HEPN domain-containing protein, partial [Thermus sp.]|uniref:HEPN domain-containing protein n=1 Tax=Thermus sp. TaxID=275 RepID=UPI00391B89F7